VGLNELSRSFRRVDADGDFDAARMERATGLSSALALFEERTFFKATNVPKQNRPSIAPLNFQCTIGRLKAGCGQYWPPHNVYSWIDEPCFDSSCRINREVLFLILYANNQSAAGYQPNATYFP